MFDFDELEEKEVGTDPANEAVLPEMPPGLKPDDPIPSFVADLEVQGSPRMVHEDPPEPGAEEAAEPTAEAPATPSANPSRPPGLPSPPREVARQDGRFLQIPRGRDVELHPLELQLARGAGKPAVKGLVVASNEQFSCLLDSTGTRVDVISNSSSMRCEVQAASRIRACALKPSDRKLLLVTQEGEVSLHRLEASGASVMFLLRFSEDVPQEVAWHPVNQKVFFTLHSGHRASVSLRSLFCPFAMLAPWDKASEFLLPKCVLLQRCRSCHFDHGQKVLRCQATCGTRARLQVMPWHLALGKLRSLSQKKRIILCRVFEVSQAQT
eukprot:g6131.t1